MKRKQRLSSQQLAEELAGHRMQNENKVSVERLNANRDRKWRYLGSGAYREVLTCEQAPGVVFKVERANRAEAECNKKEAIFWKKSTKTERKWLAPVVCHSEKYEVLVMKRIYGKKYYDDFDFPTRRLTKCIGDIHEGNTRILKSGQIVMVDYGLHGRKL